MFKFLKNIYNYIINEQKKIENLDPVEALLFKWYATDNKIDDRDYKVEILLWWKVKLPVRYILRDDEIQNQALTNPYGCVFYTWSSISNTMNYIAKEDTRISWDELCKMAINKWLLNPTRGAFISSSPELLQELWYIKTYWNCRTLEEVKLAIYNKKPVQTWSNRINRDKTKENNNRAVEWWSYGHSFFICWYSDTEELLVCENSYWKDSYKLWYFFIKYEDYDLLFQSKYIMTDMSKEEYSKLNK